MTTHAGFERLATSAIDFPLQPHERSALDEHLVLCSSCRAMAIGYRTDASALREIAFASPPERVRTAVLAAAERPIRLTTDPWKVLIAAAFLLLAVVGTTIAAGAILRLIAGPSSPIEWSAVPATPALVDDNGSLALQGVTAHADRFVAVGSGTNGAVVVTSADGSRWERAGDALVFGGAAPSDVVGVDGGFMILGSSADKPTIWTSSDGRAWDARTLDDSVGATLAAAMGNGHPVVVGNRSVADPKAGSIRIGAAWYQASGGEWRPATLSGSQAMADLRAVAWTGSGFLAITDLEVFASPDGLVWRRISAAVPHGATTLLGDGGRIVAVGSADGEPRAWTSTDGSDWTPAAFPAGATGRIAAAARHGRWIVAVGSGSSGVQSWYSTDGATWTAGGPVTDGAGGLMLDVAATQDVVVAVGALGSRAAVWSGRDARP